MGVATDASVKQIYLTRGLVWVVRFDTVDNLQQLYGRPQGPALAGIRQILGA
jgi:hypothetical protein